MKRSEIKKVLNRHRGSKARLAERLGISTSAVSMWLSGGPNSRIDNEATPYVLELLKQEAAGRFAAGVTNTPTAREVLKQMRQAQE